MAWPLDARDVSAWVQKYHRARLAYVRGISNAEVARKMLQELRYRDEALQIEMLEWERDKRRRRGTNLAKARRDLKDYMNEPGTVTAPSSV